MRHDLLLRNPLKALRSMDWRFLICQAVKTSKMNERAPKRTLSELYIDKLVQERRNSSALAMELRFSCTYTSMCHIMNFSLCYRLL